MHQYPFIFSDERRDRLKRHIVFWLVWWLTQGFLYSFIAISMRKAYMVRLQSSIVESLIYLTVHIFLSYMLMYFVIPRFLMKQRYWLTATWVITLFIAAALMSGILSLTIIPAIRATIMGEAYETNFRGPAINLFLSLMAGLRGAITIGGIAAAIKLMKLWYVKEQHNLQLQKENAESQLQVLKAQVHPHFLFNTLNNIYSYTLHVSPKASGLLIGLSDMLRYMLYECNQPLVPISKEIKMLQDYCSLEQVRYDHQLDLQITITGNKEDFYIAPLLLLPFVENCFKHGASNLVEQAWVSLTIDVEDTTMKMKLINSKPVDTTLTQPGNAKKGIGITNAQTRLKLLYPHSHELTITNEPELFIVNLVLQLEQKPVQKAEVNPIKNEVEYA